LTVFALAAPSAIGQATAAATSIRFTTGRSALKIPIEIDNNLILIRMSFNGKRPIRLIFDTGASMTALRVVRAAEFGIKGTVQASGNATGGRIEGQIARGVSLSVPGVEVSPQPVGIFPFPQVPGFDFDGVVGYHFINQFVVEIDYLKKVMNLYDRRSYRYRGKGAVVPLILKNRETPLVSTGFLFTNGQRNSAMVELDTGGDSAFVLRFPFVNKHALLKTSKDLTESGGRGAGGEQERLLGRAKTAKLGPFVFRDVPVLFSLQKEANDPGVDGIVGGEILRRFKLIIDYSRSRMILEPNKDLRSPIEVEG